MRAIIFILIYLLLGLRPLLALDDQRQQQDNNQQKERNIVKSSSSRGCQVKLPKIEVKMAGIKQTEPEIQLRATEAGYEVLMSLYTLKGDYLHWQTRTTSKTDWQVIMPDFRLEKGRKYVFVLVTPCNGNIPGGEKIYEVIELKQSD